MTYDHLEDTSIPHHCPRCGTVQTVVLTYEEIARHDWDDNAVPPEYRVRRSRKVLGVIVSCPKGCMRTETTP